MADLFANLPGAPVARPSLKEVTDSEGGYARSARLLELESLLPAITPQQLDRTIELGIRYREFVARVEELGAFIGKEMEMDFLTTQGFPAFMEDLIKQSAANLRGNKGKKLDSEGNEVVRYFKASTLAGYCTQLIQLVKLAHPDITSEERDTVAAKIWQCCKHLQRRYELEDPMPMIDKPVVGPHHVRMMVDYYVKRNAEVTDVDLMMIVAVIVLMLTACRPGTIFSTTAWADRYLTWEDVALSPKRNKENTIVGIDTEITLRHFKGHQGKRKPALIKKFRFEACQLPGNQKLDIGTFLFAHAWRQGAIDTSGGIAKYFAPEYRQESYILLRPKDPVFWAITEGGKGLKSSIGADRAFSAPGFNAQMASLAVRLQARLPDGASLTAYAFRRGTLTALYFNPSAGPEVARLTAAHAPGSVILEKHYIDWSQLDHLMGSVLGEAVTARVPEEMFAGLPEDIRATRLLRRDLVASDIYLQKVLEGLHLLEQAVAQGSLEWKSFAPFSSNIPKFISYDDEDTVTLLLDLKGVFRRRESALRLERRKDLTTATSVTQPVSRQWTQQEIDAATVSIFDDLRTEDDIDQTVLVATNEVDMEYEIGDNEYEDEAELDETSSDEVGTDGDASSGFDWGVESRIERIVTLALMSTGDKLCAKCQVDPTVPPQTRAAMHPPAKLRRHLEGYFHDHHTAFMRVLESVSAKGTKSGHHICGLSSAHQSHCGTVITRDTRYSHVINNHMSSVPSFLVDWLHEFEIERRGGRSARSKKATTKQSTAGPTQRIPALPGLPAGYQMAPPTTETSARSYWLREDLIKMCSLSEIGASDQSTSRLTINTATGEWERQVAERMHKLRQMLPFDLTNRIDNDPGSIFDNSAIWDAGQRLLEED